MEKKGAASREEKIAVTKKYLHGSNDRLEIKLHGQILTNDANQNGPEGFTFIPYNQLISILYLWRLPGNL